MSSPWPTVALCVLYYYIVRVAGPRFMKDREPLNIQNLVVVYNLFQTLFSIWIFQKACRFWFTGKYNWLCQPVDYSYTQDGFDAADMTWWYFFSKFIDFIDSFFFLFRKKFSHLSTLHVVHHGIMPLTSWFGIRSVTPPLPKKLLHIYFHQVCRGRPHDLLRVPQHGSPHHHVLLLLHGQHGTQRSEISLVEKVILRPAIEY